MPTNKQRRESARRHLERQLQHRQERAARQRRINLIVSIVATLAIIAAVVIVVVLANNGSDNKKTAAQSVPKTGVTSSAPAPTPTSSAPQVGAPAACAKPAKGSTATFKGVTVKNATDLSKAPTVTSKVTTAPKALECMDLVVGKGPAASPSSSVTVQYVGALLDNGKVFDSSWQRGQPATFSLQQVVPGFTQGIGGIGKVAPMKVGGRRIMILPSALGYGAAGSPPTIPANAALIFIVDLTKIAG